MKRLISIVLLLSLVLLVACGSTTEESRVGETVDPEESNNPIEKTTPEETQTAIETREISNETIIDWLYNDDVSELSDNLPYIPKMNYDSILSLAIDFDAGDCADALVEVGATVPENVDDMSLYEYSLKNNSSIGVRLAIQILGQQTNGYDDLVKAVIANDFSAANALIECGVDPATLGAEDYNILHELFNRFSDFSYSRFDSTCSYLLSSDDLPGYLKYSQRPEQFALFIKTALDKGVDPYAENIYGQTALSFIDTDEDSMALAALIKAGVNEWDNLTLFKSSYLCADPILLKLICDNGLDLNGSEVVKILSDIDSIHGITYELEDCYFSYLDALSENGFDFNAPINDDNENYLMAFIDFVADKSFYISYHERQDRYLEAINKLAELTSLDDIDRVNSKGETLYFKILKSEARSQRSSGPRLVKQNGRYVSIPDPEEDFLIEVLELLVDFGANPNPLIGDKYAMQLLEEDTLGRNNSADTSIVRRIKSEFGLH